MQGGELAYRNKN